MNNKKHFFKTKQTEELIPGSLGEGVIYRVLLNGHI